MATRYWVGGTANWDATAGTKWSTTSGGAGGSAVPTAADDVFIDLNSGGAITVTIPTATTVVCRSLNFVDGTGGAYTGTFAFASTSATLTIGDGTAGASNVALKLSAGMTLTLTGIGTINFISTSATQQTITTNGKTLPSITVNGVGSSYIQGDALIMDATAPTTVLTVTNGTYNTGNFNLTGNIFNTAAGTKTITLGSSAITLARNGGAINFSTSGLTMTANTATITFLFSATVSGGGVNFNGTSFTFIGGGTKTILGANTLANITVTGSANKTDIISLSADQTCTGTFTVNGNSVINRVLVASDTRGTARTITAATVSCSNVDFMDIIGAGAGSWNLSAITGNSGDCGGNSGITFTTPATQTNTGATGSWSDSTKWTSRVPLPQDDVVINTGSGTITANMPRLGKSINFTGFTGTASFNTTTELYGSLTLASGMTLGANTQAITLAGRSSYTITSAGKQFSNQIQFNNYGGTYTLQDALYTTQAITQYSGTFDTNNQTVTCLTFTTSGTITRVLTFGTSTINLTSTALPTVWSIGTTGLTMSAASSTIVISTASGNTRIFTGGGQTYGTLQYTVASSAGILQIGGSNTFSSLNIGSGRSLMINNGTTQTITTWTGSGSPTSYIYMPGDTYGASIPDSANTSIANDIDVRIRVALDDVSLAGGKRIAGKYGAAGQRSWRWYISGGQPVFETSNDGTATAVAANCTTTLSGAGLSSGTIYWLRVARDKAAGTVKFYYAADSTSVPSGGSWTQLGSTISSMSTTAIFDSTALTTVGGETSGVNSNPGKYYRFQVCSNLADDGSAIQADIDFTAKSFGADTFTESSSNAATVTMANNSIYGDGRIQIQSSSAGIQATINKPSGGPLVTASDYLAVKDIKVTQPLSFFAGANSVDKGNNNNIYFAAVGTYRHQQSIAATAAATSVSATLTAAPTAGNLLIAHVVSSGTTGGGITGPSGFTQAITVGTAPTNYIYYKIATGSETTLSYSQTTSRQLVIELIEYSGFIGTPTLDVTDSNTTASSVTSLSTTATTGPTNTTQPALALALWGSSSTMAAAVSATNSFFIDYTPGNASSVAHAAVKELTTTAAVDSTLTWTTARAGDAALLAIFRNAGTAWTQSASDSVTISDATVKAVGAGKSDTVAVADAPVKAVGSNKADSVTMSDVANKTIGLTETDVISPQDAFDRAVAYVRATSDIVTILDAFSYTNATIILQVISALLESDSKDITMQGDDKGLVLESDDNDIVIENEVI